MAEDFTLNELENELRGLGVDMPLETRSTQRLGIPLPGKTEPAATPFDPAAYTEAAQTMAGPAVPEQVNGFVRFGKNIYTGVKQGVFGEVETFDQLANAFSKYTGIDHGTALKQLYEWGKPSAEELAAGGDTLPDKVARSIGQAIPLIAQLAVGTGVVGGIAKAAKIPQYLKLGSTAATEGSRLLTPVAKAAAERAAVAAGKKALPGVLNLAEPATFGLYEATHGMLEPNATLGSTLARTAQGVAMGGALPFGRFLPHGAREAAPGLFAGGLTSLMGGTPEEALTSGITMTTLAAFPEALGMGRRAVRGKPSPTENAGTKIPGDVTPEVKLQGELLAKEVLTDMGYPEIVVKGLSSNQTDQLLNLSQGFKQPHPTLIDPATKSLIINLGKNYTIKIPYEAQSTTPVEGKPASQVLEESKATTKEVAEAGAISEQVPLTKDNLTYLSENDLLALYGSNHPLSEAAMARVRVINTAREAKATAGMIKTEGPLAGAIAKLRAIAGPNKTVSIANLDDLHLNQFEKESVARYLAAEKWRTAPSPKSPIPSEPEIDMNYIERALDEVNKPVIEAKVVPVQGVASVEELARPGKFYSVNKEGNVSYTSKAVDLMPGGEAIFQAMPDGKIKVYGTRAGLSYKDAMKKYGAKVKNVARGDQALEAITAKEPAFGKETVGAAQPAESPRQRAIRMREEADRFLAEQKAEEEMGGPGLTTEEGIRAQIRGAQTQPIGQSVRTGVSTSRRGGGMISPKAQRALRDLEQEQAAYLRGKGTVGAAGTTFEDIKKTYEVGYTNADEVKNAYMAGGKYGLTAQEAMKKLTPFVENKANAAKLIQQWAQEKAKPAEVPAPAKEVVAPKPGKIPEFELPKSSPEAFAKGISIRNNPALIVKLFDDYVAANEDIKKIPNRQEALDVSVRNQMRAETIDTALKTTKIMDMQSLYPEDRAAKVNALREQVKAQEGAYAEPVTKGEVLNQARIAFKEERREAKGEAAAVRAGNVIHLVDKTNPAAKHKLTLGERTKLIESLVDTKENPIGGWSRGTLRNLSDDSLENIRDHNLLYENTKLASMVDGKPVFASTKPGAAVLALAGATTPDAKLLRDAFEKSLLYPKDVVDSIDWDKMSELKKEGKWPKFGKRDMEKIQTKEDMEIFLNKEQEVGIGEATTGVPNELLAKTMLSGMNYKEVTRRLTEGKSLPDFPIPEGVYKGVPVRAKTGHAKQGFESKDIKDAFAKQLSIASNDRYNTMFPPTDLTMAEEVALIMEALPGFRFENVGVEGAPNAAQLSGKIIDSFRKLRKGNTFPEAAANAFATVWDKFIKPKDKGTFLAEVDRINRESISEDVDLELMKDVTKRLKGTVGAAAATPKAGMIPQTEADKLVLEATKAVDPLQPYNDVLKLLESNVKKLHDANTTIGRQLAAKDAAAESGNTALVTQLQSQIDPLVQQRTQLLVDNNYLFDMRDKFVRYGKPAKKPLGTFIETELFKNEHGIDGTVISKHNPKGATFYVVQNAQGGGVDTTNPGNTIFGSVEVAARKTKGEIERWQMPAGTDPRAESEIYNSIKERYAWKQEPISISIPKGVADRVLEISKDRKYDVISRPPILEKFGGMAPFDAFAREQIYTYLKDAVKDSEGKPFEPLSNAKRAEFLKRAVSLNDGGIDYDLEKLRIKPEELGISDPALAGMKLEFMPLIDRIADPTQSGIPEIAAVGNFALKAKYAISDYITSYAKMAEEYLGEFKNDDTAKAQIFKHLVYMGKLSESTYPKATSQEKIAAKSWLKQNAAWKLDEKVEANQKLLNGARGYRMIMDDLANLFKLRDKGLYRENYATLKYDLASLWDNIYSQKFGMDGLDTADKLPLSILAKIDPAHFGTLREIALTRKPWDKLTPLQQANVTEKFFKWNGAYDAWESLPEASRARIPKQKFIAQFQHRTADGNNLPMESIANQDVWEVLNNYIFTVVRDGVMSDYFLPRARRTIGELRAAGIGETQSVRGFAEAYIKQVAGFGHNTPTSQFMNSILKTINGWVGKETVPELGGGATQQAANLYTRMLYRGAIGIDTAIRNLTQTIYTAADLGPVNWFKGLNSFVQNGLKKTPEYTKFAERQRLVEEFFDLESTALRKSDRSLLEKWGDLDRRLTAITLHPMRITEHINRGITYFAGLADAKDRGLSFNSANILGMEYATKYAHPLEMSEAEWFATRDMYKSQFGYGKEHTSPLMYGTMMKFFTPFWSFPVKSLQFWSNLGKESMGIERWGEVGKKESWAMSNDNKAKMARFLALTGFLTTAPYLIANTLGLDAGYLWGKGIIPGSIAPAWVQAMENFYVGVLGGVGMDIAPTEKDKDKARKNMLNTVFMLGVPQWRFGKKVVNVVDNLEKGYYAMGPNELPVAETTFGKEVVNLLGFPPYTRDAKSLVWEAYRERGDQVYIKQDAMKEISKKYEGGDYEGATKLINRLYEKTGVRLGSDDIRDYSRRKQRDTAFDEAEKHLTKQMKGEWQGKLREAKARYLPHGGGQRNFWTGTGITAPIEQKTPRLSSYLTPYAEETSEGEE